MHRYMLKSLSWTNLYEVTWTFQLDLQFWTSTFISELSNFSKNSAKLV